MAAFDVLHTPPHTCPTSMVLQSDVALPQFQCLSSTPTSAQIPSQMIESDEISSSDKENYSCHAVSKATANTTLTQASEHAQAISPTKHHMSFTPRRERPPPRAWERRPATPFITRTEGQKIWKRVPLAELGVEANRQLSRQEEKDLENYVRVVKRMRVNDSMDNNHGALHYQGSLGTKWEEDSIEKGGSPKKKVRADNSETPLISDEHSSTDQKGNQLDAPIACSSMDMQRADDVVPVTQVNVRLAEESVTNTVQASVEALQDRIVDSESISHTENASVANATVLPLIRPLDGNEAQTEHAGGLDAFHSNTLEVTPNTPASESLAIISDLALVPTVPPESTVISNNDLQNLLMEEITTHKVSPIESDCNATNALDSKTHASQITSPTTALTTTIFAMSDHDDTAFLRDFLHRAQASKAARVAISPQKKSLPLQSVNEDEQLCLDTLTSDVLETTEENEDDDLSPPIETARIEQAFEAADTKFISPTRRGLRPSTRKARSRLPRSQTSNIPPAPHFGPVLPSQNMPALPSTIQLKRATGCEFIFTAKEQQTLAMMTRANTKKNQGGAVHVEQRLAQLKKESDAFQQNEQHVTEQVDPDEILCDAEIDENKPADVKSTLKKRKRDRQDDSKSEKVKRTVKWPSDEQLARYQEPSPFVESESLLEDSLSRVDPDTTVALAQTTATSSTTSEISTMNGMTDPNTKSRDTTDELSKLKVRRIRKVKLNSVNGTPAPKTRSRSMVESGSDEAGLDMSSVDHSDTSALKAGTRRSSRMPVPVTTPIPLPSFSTITKALTRSAEKERSKGTDKVDTHTEENVNAQSARKPVGRRQLRTKRS